MNRTTITALNQLNQDFYQSIAPSFSGTRHYAWNSWQKYATFSQVFQRESLSFFDFGCGNGRFGSWLLDQGKQVSYTGLDSNEYLLKEARAALPDKKFIQQDIIELLMKSDTSFEEKFDCIAVFGVIHHIPSFELRQKLFLFLAEHLNPDGEIWITAWHPQGNPLDTKSMCERAAIDTTELEPGDQFFGWKDSSVVRYVHSLQPQEMNQLLANTGLAIIHEWSEEAQGERGNLCFLLQK